VNIDFFIMLTHTFNSICYLKLFIDFIEFFYREAWIKYSKIKVEKTIK